MVNIFLEPRAAPKASRTAALRTVLFAPRAASAVSSDTIFKVQQKLHDLGFYVRDNIDGQWGPNTSAAVKNFQRSKGMKASGQLNSETLSALEIR